MNNCSVPPSFLLSSANNAFTADYIRADSGIAKGGGVVGREGTG